jgi:ribonuclease Z
MMDRLFWPDGAFMIDLTARTKSPESLKIYQNRGGNLPRPWPDRTVTEMKESDVIEGNDWVLHIANVPHHQPYLTYYGVRLESSDGVFAYTSDISLPPEQGPAKPLNGLAQNADVLEHYLNAFSFDPAKSGPS